MIVHNCKQGSDEWHRLRLGKPTSSEFNRILKPSNLEPSASQIPYAIQLATELNTGELASSGSSAWMERGKKLEAEAISWYQCFHLMGETKSVGFITDDKNQYGCSPDQRVGEKAGLEVKNLAAVTHGLYIEDPNKLVAKCRLQVQGSLWITGFEWWDLMSYNPMPETKNVVVRVLPDPDVFAALDSAMPLFLELIETKRQAALNKPVELPLSEMGY